MLKKFIGCLLGCFLVLILAACNSEPTTSTVPTQAQAVELKVWAWGAGLKGLQSNLPGFYQANPNIKVNLIEVDQTEIADKLDSGLMAGGIGLPDVVQVETERVDYFITKFPEGFADLKSWAAKYNGQFDALKWFAVQRIGRIRAVPWDSGPVGLYYRSDLFQQAGINPDSIETWDDLIRAGEKLRALSNNPKLLALDVDSDILIRSMLHEQGLSYFTADGKINLTLPEAVRAMTTIKRMYSAGMLNLSVGEEAIIPALTSGKAVAYVANAGWATTLRQQAPEMAGKWAVMPLPAMVPGGSRTASFGGSMLAALRTGKNQEAASAFIEYCLANRDSQNLMLKEAGMLPSYLPAYEDPFYAVPQPYFSNKPIWQFFAREVRQLKPTYFTKDYELAANAAANAQVVAFFRFDPEQALFKKATELKDLTAREIAKPSVEARR